MSVLDIVDEIAALLEPTSTKRDATAARPVVFDPDVLYAWPRNERFTPDGTGALDEDRFALRIAWAADESGEIAAEIRSRAVSKAIDDKVAALAALIRGHRTGTTYEQVQVDAVDYENLITNTVRGFYLDLSGYQLTS